MAKNQIGSDSLVSANKRAARERALVLAAVALERVAAVQMAAAAMPAGRAHEALRPALLPQRLPAWLP
ncbi:hypothetical protein [Xanthomonas theicola]|uniref:hypothetical protein n=1 Tax=Xanthomonas theicola TaxID=56464 RepID=UPI000FF89581|nr:hypothetical protein G4Q83_21650 [Xanthomonas theicola]